MKKKITQCYAFNFIHCTFDCYHYGISVICCVPEAHGKDHNAHGKIFAVCSTRQTAHGILRPAKPGLPCTVLAHGEKKALGKI